VLNAARMNRLKSRVTGATFVSIPRNAIPASLTLTCAAFSATKALARLSRVWINVAVVNAVFPSVNDSFGKCF
jgi:hypothetical protein